MEVELRLVAAQVIWVPELLGAASADVDSAHATQFKTAYHLLTSQASGLFVEMSQHSQAVNHAI